MQSMPNFAEASWRRIKTRVERQRTTGSHIRVRHPWKTCYFTSFSASVFTLNHQIFNLFSTTKVIPKFLLPFESQASFQSEEFGSYDYAPRLVSLVACSLSSLSAHAHAKKTPVVTKTFLEVSRCSRAKHQQRNVQKKCAARAKLLSCELDLSKNCTAWLALLSRSFAKVYSLFILGSCVSVSKAVNFVIVL